jgi:hypothetical protein
MVDVDEINALCSEIAEEDQQNYLASQIAAFLEEQEELQNRELQKQYEAMSRAAELENFSPFDTVNS